MLLPLQKDGVQYVLVEGGEMLDFICPTCGTFGFDDASCAPCDGRGDDPVAGSRTSVPR